MRSRRTVQAYRTHRAAPARRPPRPGHLTTDNRIPNTEIPRVRAQMGARSRVTTNIQAPNTVGVNRCRAVKDMRAQNTGENRVQVTQDELACTLSKGYPDSDLKAPAIRPHRAARPSHPFPFHITRRGPRVQAVQSRVQPRRPFRAKSRLPRPRQPAPLYQPCRELRRPQQHPWLRPLQRHPRPRHPHRPRPYQRRRRHNSPEDRTRRSPETRRMPRAILGMPAAAAPPGGIWPRLRSPRVRSLPWPRFRSRPRSLRALGVRRERCMALRRPADARRQS
jgi:hypothetical protein